MKSILSLFLIATIALAGPERETTPTASVESQPSAITTNPDDRPASATVLPPAETTGAVTPTASTIENNGQTFTLANRTTGQNVETDEYILTGERLADWTQLVTVQRLTLARATPTNEFLAYFQKRIQAENGATLEILKQSPTSTVFAVAFPRSERNDEQVMICLAFVEPSEPTRLNVVQYAVKPSRVTKELAEAQASSWRAKFLAQGNAAKTE